MRGKTVLSEVGCSQTVHIAGPSLHGHREGNPHTMNGMYQKRTKRTWLPYDMLRHGSWVLWPASKRTLL